MFMRSCPLVPELSHSINYNIQSCSLRDRGLGLESRDRSRPIFCGLGLGGPSLGLGIGTAGLGLGTLVLTTRLIIYHFTSHLEYRIHAFQIPI